MAHADWQEKAKEGIGSGLAKMTMGFKRAANETEAFAKTTKLKGEVRSHGHSAAAVYHALG